jgi:hypothetical protein
VLEERACYEALAHQCAATTELSMIKELHRSKKSSHC